MISQRVDEIAVELRAKVGGSELGVVNIDSAEAKIKADDFRREAVCRVYDFRLFFGEARGGVIIEKNEIKLREVKVIGRRERLISNAND